MDEKGGEGLFRVVEFTGKSQENHRKIIRYLLDSHLVLYTIGLFSLSGFILLYTIIIFFAWCNAEYIFSR